jgi:hypothetical protein
LGKGAKISPREFSPSGSTLIAVDLNSGIRSALAEGDALLKAEAHRDER